MRTESGVWRQRLDLTATIVMLAAGVSLLWVIFVGRAAGAGPSDAGRVVLPGALAINGLQSDGNPQAPVVLIEYTDFQCPYCGQFVRDTLPRLKSTYVMPGKVRLVVNNRPLSIHPFASEAAAAFVCAGAQGKGWEMHDLLFANQTSLSGDAVATFQKQLALDAPSFATCLGKAGPAQVLAEAAAADALGVKGTPLFYVGLAANPTLVQVKAKIAGAQAFDAFASAIDATLIAAQKK